MTYQTIPFPDGTIQKGAFDTIDWFKRMAKHVNFRDKILIDVGCCQFSYGIQALNKGAAYIYGLDSDAERIKESQENIIRCNYKENTCLEQGTAEEYQPPKSNIILFSMIIHWLKNPEVHIKRLISNSNVAIFLYRVRGYDNDTGYLPTSEELDALVGQKHSHYEVISETKEQNIRLAIYNLFLD